MEVRERDHAPLKAKPALNGSTPLEQYTVCELLLKVMSDDGTRPCLHVILKHEMTFLHK